MPFNGTGTFNLVSGNPVVTGTNISSTVQNNTMSDFANGFTNCITRDGQSAPTSNLPMGNQRHTGAANASGTGEYLVYGQALVGSAVTTTGNATIGGDAQVNGTASLATLVVGPGTATVDDIDATGNATVGGTLDIGGVATFDVTPAGKVTAGKYTPTLSNDSNATSLTVSSNTWKWLRVGDTVSVSGLVSTGASVTGQVRFLASLPVASNFALSGDLAGSGTHYIPGSASVAVRIEADATNDRALFAFPAPITSAMIIMFNFSYEVI